MDVATDFNVRYFGPYKIVTNERANETYVVYQCGTPDPADLAPGTIPGVDMATAKVFEIPLRSVSVGDTTADTFLVRTPGRARRLAGVQEPSPRSAQGGGELWHRLCYKCVVSTQAAHTLGTRRCPALPRRASWACKTGWPLPPPTRSTPACRSSQMVGLWGWEVGGQVTRVGRMMHHDSASVTRPT